MIPNKDFDYIRPRSGIGPWSISSLSQNVKNVPDGHIVFGWVSLSCPECESRKDYWLLYKHKEFAWYSIIEPDELPFLMKNLTTVINSGIEYPEKITGFIPIDSRIPVPEAYWKSVTNKKTNH